MDLFQKFQKNKFNLNPKSLYAVYKQIKDNPDINSKDYIFKSLIKEISSLDENTQNFLIDEFTTNKNSELETYYTLYESNKEKEEFIESIEMFMNKASTKKSLIKYSLNKIKSEISSNLLKKNENDNNEDLVRKSKEIIKILQKYNLFNEKEYNIIMNSLENDDDVFTATFQVLFDDQDLIEFYETMNLALENQMKKDANKGEPMENWNNDLIKKNYKEIKKKNYNFYDIEKEKKRELQKKSIRFLRKFTKNIKDYLLSEKKKKTFKRQKTVSIQNQNIRNRIFEKNENENYQNYEKKKFYFY
jgi:hypothetical protein